MKRFILILLLKICCVVLYSVDFNTAEVTIQFTRYDINNGLSDNTIHCITQDSRGFMWFGTSDGLNMYDGYSFKYYKNNPKNINSIGNSTIRSLLEDRNKNYLWVGTQGGGLSKIDLVTDTIVNYTHNKNDSNSLSGNRIMSIAQDNQGRLWLGTEKNGVTLFDPLTNSFTRYKLKGDNNTSSFDINITSIYIDHTGTVFFCAGPYLVEYLPETDSFKKHNLNVYPTSIIEVSNGSLLVGGHDGLIYNFNKDTGEYYPWKEDHFTKGRAVMNISEDYNNNLWIITSGDGLYKYDSVKDEFYNYRNNKSVPYSISGNNLFSVYTSDEGIIWLGTRGAGLNKFVISQEKFGHYSVNPGNPNSLRKDIVFALEEDLSGDLWIGHEKGQVSRFNRKTGNFTHYDLQIVGRSVAFVHAIYADPDGTVWAGGWGLGVHRYNPKTDKFELVYTRNEENFKDPDSISTYDILALYRDSHNQFWIGVGYAAQNRIDLNTGKIYKYEKNPEDPYTFSDNEVTKIYEDSKGELWFTTFSNGINRYDRKNDRFISYKNNESPNSLSNNTVYIVREDNNGDMWFGTHMGLCKFNRETETFKRYTEDDGLLHNVIYGLEIDANNNIWMSGGKGLCKFNPKDNTFEFYNSSNGLQSNLFRWSVSGKTKAGELMFGGVNGFNIFNPEDIERNSYVPKTIITDLKLFNKSVSVSKDSRLDKNINDMDKLTFTHLDDVISFEFTSLSYTSSDRNRYRYKLSGFEDEWNYVDSSRRFATYTTLPAGDYTFMVQGSNNDGLWDNKGSNIDVYILPPFWETWWFFCLISIGIITIILIIFLQIINRLKAEKETSLLEQKMDLAKKIQTALLPDDNLHEDFDVSSIMIPADEVGGDYYDYCYDRNKDLWIAIGDVAGHGITAGLVMMMAQTAHYDSINMTKKPEPNQVISDINKTLYHNVSTRLKNTSFMSFLTMKYEGEGKFKFAGQHLDILIYRKSIDKIEAIETSGVFLNMIENIDDFENKTFQLDIGDTMLLYTDGAIEVFNENNEIMDITNLKKAFLKHSKEDVKELKESLYREIIDWGGDEIEDDITLLVIRREK